MKLGKERRAFGRGFGRAERGLGDCRRIIVRSIFAKYDRGTRNEVIFPLIFSFGPC